MNEAVTYLVIITQPHLHTPWRQRFNQTLKADPIAEIIPFGHPETPPHPHGTSTPVVLHALGHEPGGIGSLKQLSPQHLRQLRDLIYRVRQSDVRLHLFGLLDNYSPYGSRRLVEEVIRLARQTSSPISLHLGVWHPLPNDFQRGLREIQSLVTPNFQIASLFPLEQVLHHRGARRYVDGLSYPTATATPIHDISLPLRQPYYFSTNELHDTDYGLIVNHSLHGLHQLEDSLAERWQRPVVSFTPYIPNSNSLERMLNQSRHIMVVTHRPQYAHAFVGDIPSHPYFESIIGESPEHIVEMFISPHFGYHKPPYRTIILLDEAASGQFDWLLSSVIKLQRTNPYVCCWINPTGFEKNYMMSNYFTDPSQLYQANYPYG